MKYKLSLEQIAKYVCCGGNSSSKKLPYFYQVFGNRIDLPPQAHECVCGHYIERNFYIRNSTLPVHLTETKDLLVIGCCCVEQFTETGIKQTCTFCQQPTTRRKTTICFDCVNNGVCEECHVKHDRLVKGICYSCYNANRRDDDMLKKCGKLAESMNVTTPASVRTYNPTWVDFSDEHVTPDQLCLQWEGRRLATRTYLYLFKYLDLTPPWEELHRVFYVRYRRPADHADFALLCQSVEPYQELQWKPFMAVSRSNSAAPFVIRQVDQDWQFMRIHKDGRARAVHSEDEIDQFDCHH